MKFFFYLILISKSGTWLSFPFLIYPKFSNKLRRNHNIFFQKKRSIKQWRCQNMLYRPYHDDSFNVISGESNSVL